MFIIFWEMLKKLAPVAWSPLKESFLTQWSDPESRKRMIGAVLKNIVTIALSIGLYYSIDSNVELIRQNDMLSQRIEIMMTEKLQLENTCAREAPKQQEYSALEERLIRANSQIKDLKEKLDLCTVNKADSVNRRLRELTRK